MSHVDRPSAVIAASYLAALNALLVNLQPLILGAMAEGYGLTDRELGYVSSVFVGFNTLIIATGPWWVRRINWRMFTACAVAAASAAVAAGALVSQLWALLLIFALVGVTKGLIFVPTFASLGDATNPDRGYGVSVAFQSLMAAAAAAPLAAWVMPAYGVQGLFVTVAAVTATGLVACGWLPAEGRVDRTAHRGSDRPLWSLAAVPAVVALAALMAFGGGVAAFWFFVERIGTARGVSPAFIGLTLSITALSGILTSSIVAWIGGRVSSLNIIAVGLATIWAGYGALALAPTPGFVLCNLLFALGWGLSTPAFWALLRKVDATGRLFVAAAAASGLAAVLVGAVAGPVIERGGYTGLTVFSGGLLLVGFALAVLAQRIAAAVTLHPEQIEAGVAR